MKRTIQVVAGDRTNGTPVFEELHVEELGPGLFALLQSPGLVLGVAAGDVLEVADRRIQSVLSRGNNLSIQIFPGTAGIAAERAATTEIAGLGGWLDGKSEHQLVYTIPVSVGFPAVEAVLDKLAALHPPLEWYFGNVYDPRDGVTPLNWW